MIDGDFPGGPVVKNPPSNVDDSGSILAQGTKIPNDQGLPKEHTATWSAATNEPSHHSKHPACHN